MGGAVGVAASEINGPNILGQNFPIYDKVLGGRNIRSKFCSLRKEQSAIRLTWDPKLSPLYLPTTNFPGLPRHIVVKVSLTVIDYENVIKIVRGIFEQKRNKCLGLIAGALNIGPIDLLFWQLLEVAN